LPAILQLRYSQDYLKPHYYNGQIIQPPQLFFKCLDSKISYYTVATFIKDPVDSQTENFYSEEELYRVWPILKPEIMYDFSQEKGEFCVTRGSGFLWKNINGRYYFDEETFNHIPSSFFCSRNYGYVDLVLTREAIKHQAWKLFSVGGQKHYDDFLTDFPESMKEYEKAVWDSHTSIYAKNMI
jgi:hypothetical protein